MERRKQARYWFLVKAHMRTRTRTSAGPSVGSPGLSGFAATQALWRFLNNERVTLPALAEPLRAAGLLALLPIPDLLEACDGDLRQLRDLAPKAIPFLDTG